MKMACGGHENLPKNPGTIASGADRIVTPIILRDLPGVAEIERLAHGEGEWLTEAELQQRAEQVSVALFGVRKADTYSRKTAPPSLEGDEWSRAMARPDDWELPFTELYYDDGSWEERPGCCWDIEGVDGEDEYGLQLRCFHYFARQIIVVLNSLMPEAKFTPDGSGRRNQSAENWGAALERQAARFKPSR